MKTTLHLLSLLLLSSLCLQAQNGMATGIKALLPVSSTPASLAVSVIQNTEDKFSIKLIFENYLQGSVLISLLSADGQHTYFTQSVAQSKYIR